MRRLASFIITAIISLSLTAAVSAAVFHGTDAETGKQVSRTAVDSVDRAGEIKIGLKVVHFAHKPCVLIFTSLDKDLFTLDRTTAALIVDGRRVPLAFDQTRELAISPLLPAVQELHFKPLDPATLDKLAAAKTLSLSIASPTGMVFTRDFAQEKLADVQEVLRGAKAAETGSDKAKDR